MSDFYELLDKADEMVQEAINNLPLPTAYRQIVVGLNSENEDFDSAKFKDFSEIADGKHPQFPGVYFAYTIEPDKKVVLYVGQGENMHTRITSHIGGWKGLASKEGTKKALKDYLIDTKKDHLIIHIDYIPIPVNMLELVEKILITSKNPCLNKKGK